MSAWRVEKTEEGSDLVFEGWENGVGDSPFTGNDLIRQVNVIDSPKEAFVGYDLLNQYTPPDSCSGTTDGHFVFSYTRATNTLTGTKNEILTGTPIIFPANTFGSTIYSNHVYYAFVVTVTATTGTFKVCATLANAIAGTGFLDTATGTSQAFTVRPIGPVFSGFGGPTGQIAPYPATYTDSTATAFQYFGDSTGNENGSAYYGQGNLWYYIGVSNNQTGWTLADTGAAMIVASVDTGAETLTMPAGTTIATGTAVKVTTDIGGALPSPLVAGTIYYAINSSATAFKLATTLANALANTPINLTTTGSGNIEVRFAEGVYGLAAWNGYVFVFRNYQIDLMNISSGVWTIGWSVSQADQGYTAALSHRALVVATDNRIYFCNGSKLGFIKANDGTTFDPASTTTYSYQTNVLLLPTSDSAISLALLGSTLMIGGIFNVIYSWNRQPGNTTGNPLGTAYTPLFCPEQNIAEMITVNTTTYIFAGYRGRIYQTNGSSVLLYKKLPDHTTGTIMPIIYWKCSGTDRNQLMFSVECYDNSGTVLDGQTAEAGLWAINLGDSIGLGGAVPTAQALRLLQAFSCGLNTGMTNMFGTFIMPIARSSSGGLSFVTGWTVRSSSVNYSGFDGFVAQAPTTTGGTPDGAYIVGGAQMLTDLVRVGSTFTKRTFGQVEWTLSQALANGEKVQIEARNAINGNWTVVGSTTAASGSAQLSDVYTVNFQEYVWLQFRITLYSVAFTSSPSYVRFRDLRCR